jgi:lysozyme family protein
MLISSFGALTGSIFNDSLGAAKKKTAAPVATATQKANVKRLQAALATLGKVVGSAQLKAVKADGVIGPKTVAAVNWAFTHHIGAGQAAAQYRTGKLPQDYVLFNANTLSNLIETEIARRGAKAASPATVSRGAAVKAVQTAPTATSANPKAAAKRLQIALANLGKVVGSAQLKAVKADGAVGAKTVAAVNWAFTHHIGSGQAPANLRTGKLTLAYVKGNADTIATFVENEIKRRGAKAPAGSKEAVQAAQAVPVTKANAKALQAALVNLGKAVGSAQLKAIKVDGAIGAKTVAAVNWAFTHHIGSGQAPAKFRTGNLSLVDVKANLGTITTLIDTETRRRGGASGTAAATKKAAAKKVATSKAVLVKTKDGKTVKATKVATAEGETYEVEDPETGQKYFTPDPTVAPPPAAPSSLPEPTEEQEEAAAEASAASAAQGSRAVTVPESFEPSGGGFLSEYKWPIIGGFGALALIVTGALVLKRRPGGGAAAPARTTPARRRR